MEANYAEQQYRRPGMSGLAITGFVLSLVIGLVSIIGIWWANAIPLLFAIPGWMAISAGRKRGLGFAITAVVISVLAAGGVYLMWKAVATFAEQGFHKYLTTLEKGDEGDLRAWVAPGQDPTEAVSRWKQRMAKTREAVGAYTGGAEVPMGLWGPMVSMTVPPSGVVELDGGGPAPASGVKSLWLWSKVSFEEGKVWVAVELPAGQEGKFKGGDTGDGVPIFRDIRFFRAAGG